MSELDSRVAIVTGAGQGMGQAIALELSSRGAKVFALDLNPDTVTETASLDAKGRVTPLACDVSKSAAVDEVFGNIEADAGPVDILVNNAGIGRAPGDGSDTMYELMGKRNEELAADGHSDVFVDHLIHMDDEGWQGVMDVNLNGTFYCTRAAVRSMIAHDIKGSIISIASTAAQSGEGAVHYVTSKAAIVGLTRSLARELGPRGIRINAVAPGPTNTPVMAGIPDEWIADMEAAIPLGRMAEPSEIAAAVGWLASDASSMCTGSVLVANGGSYFF